MFIGVPFAWDPGALGMLAGRVPAVNAAPLSRGAVLPPDDLLQNGRVLDLPVAGQQQHLRDQRFGQQERDIRRRAKDRPHAGWTVAASICGAIDALTRALAVELAPIRVNAVSPGVVRTALWDNMAESDREALYREVGSALPVGRVGEASDIAEAYLYLMREGFSTGQVIAVDGGTMLM